MIDQFSVFSKSGVVLWCSEEYEAPGSPGRSSESQFDQGSYSIKWRFMNDMDLVFVCVYQKILKLLYVEELLDKVKNAFLSHFENEENLSDRHLPVDFDVMYKDILEEVELGQLRRKPREMRGFVAKEKGQRNGVNGSQKTMTKAEKKRLKNGGDENSKPFTSRVKRKNNKDNDDNQKKIPNRSWNDASSLNRPISKKDIAKWNKNESEQGIAAGDCEEKMILGESQMEILTDDDSSDEDVNDKNETSKSSWSFGGAMDFLKGLSGNKPLKRSDIDEALTTMEHQLIENNVSRNIASDLCESVAATLIDSLKDAMTRVLTPKKSIDVLRSAFQAKAEGRPYSIVFIGVNGVGKSTSLSKVCYYLLQKKLSVSIAACDTFRSGAVEQLKVHGRRLGVNIFEKGYAKDPAQVATAAIKEAKKEGTDVVLIDTAGRMQNNTKLMKALAKLVTDTKPDLVLFVGEALVGNDGVDQLKFFNQALADNSSASTPRLIDGIVLTKFDTIDDKVGAALSMVYVRQPILFVGTGQKYTHLRRLNVQTVVKALFK
eukprot:GSMAST32.ASY1.ANO1.1715.1 assembled CDS